SVAIRRAARTILTRSVSESNRTPPRSRALILRAVSSHSWIDAEIPARSASEGSAYPDWFQSLAGASGWYARGKTLNSHERATSQLMPRAGVEYLIRSLDLHPRCD